MTTTNEAHSPIRTGSIVAAVDGSSHADQAVAWAAEEARLPGRPLTIRHVARALGSQERAWLAEAGIPLEQVTQEIRTDAEEVLHQARTAAAIAAPGVEIEAVLRVGDPREILLGLADRASMIVLGSRGRGAVSSLLLGSVSVAVSRQAACPVLVLRPSRDAAPARGVLVATNGTAQSAAALETAFREASFHTLPLTVVHCQWEALVSSGGWRAAHPGDPFYDTARIRVSEALAGLREKFPDVPVDVEIFAGHVDHCVADLSRQHRLTVIGRHARTLLERVGSFSLTTAVLEHASGPVLIVP
jgi:nucleotide-binding universal stress UspA family protein